MSLNIVIATGIYPPEIGGPAEYAKELSDSFKRKGHTVKIATFTFERKLPTSVRHLWFFGKLLAKLWRADFIIALDTFSVALPAVIASMITGKKIIIRTGGDFLWEQYIERTREKILFRKFYEKPMPFSLKERMIFAITKIVLNRVDALVFSTKWQKDVWERPYSLSGKKQIWIIENCFREKIDGVSTFEKRYVAGVRNLVWKNTELLVRAFDQASKQKNDIVLDLENLPYEAFQEKIKKAYAVILVSLGDISPNLILDALKFNKPFILTKENGLKDRLGDIGIYVDPLDEEAIVKAIVYLSDESVYKEQVEKVRNFNFLHNYDDIAEEFIKVYSAIS